MKFFTTASGALYAIESVTYVDTMMGYSIITGYNVTRFVAEGNKVVPTWNERVDNFVVDDGRLKFIKDHKVWGYSTTVETVGAGV